MKDSSLLVQILKGFLGIMAAKMLIALISASFVTAGIYLVNKNNKKGTKPFRDIQQEQYLGCTLVFIGMLPWIEYFMMSFAWQAGSAAFENIL